MYSGASRVDYVQRLWPLSFASKPRAKASLHNLAVAAGGGGGAGRLVKLGGIQNDGAMRDASMLCFHLVVVANREYIVSAWCTSKAGVCGTRPHSIL